MGYGFMVWAVDTSKLQQVAGSKDEKLCRMIGGRFKHDVAGLDDLFSHQIASGKPDTRTALRQIVDGTVPPDVSNGAVYFYAFKLLVQHFGRPLDNSAVYPWSSPDFAPLDAAFVTMGVPLKLGRLYGSSLPVKLPSPDDFPLTGWIDAAEVKAIDTAFGKAKPVKLEGDAAEILPCVRGWFGDATKLGRGLVSYYH